MESAPVIGVAIRKVWVALFDAPLFLKALIKGITLHEHRGRGIPSTAALRVEVKLCCPK